MLGGSSHCTLTVRAFSPCEFPTFPPPASLSLFSLCLKDLRELESIGEDSGNGGPGMSRGGQDESLDPRSLGGPRRAKRHRALILNVLSRSGRFS